MISWDENGICMMMETMVKMLIPNSAPVPPSLTNQIYTVSKKKTKKHINFPIFLCCFFVQCVFPGPLAILFIFRGESRDAWKNNNGNNYKINKNVDDQSSYFEISALKRFFLKTFSLTESFISSGISFQKTEPVLWTVERPCSLLIWTASRSALFLRFSPCISPLVIK